MADGCKYCTPRDDDSELCGEYVWGYGESLDGMSSGRLSIWHDEFGCSCVILIDGPRRPEDGTRFPSIASLELPYCPFCGRRLG